MLASLQRWKLSPKVFHLTDSLFCVRCARRWSSLSHFLFSTVLFESSQSHRLGASITFLFHLGCVLSFPYGISSMTDIVAPEILRGDFLDAQSLSPCFILCWGITYTTDKEKEIKTFVRHTGCALCVNKKQATTESCGRGL